MAYNVDGTINIINKKAPITGQYHYSKLGKNHDVAFTEAKLQENNKPFSLKGESYDFR